MRLGLSKRPRRRAGACLLAPLALAFLGLAATKADADVAVRTESGDVSVTVERDTLDHVMEALRTAGVLQYRSFAPLNEVVDGSFAGRAERVVAAILAGFDYAAKYGPRSIEVIVFAKSAAGAAPAAPDDASALPARAQQPQTVNAPKALAPALPVPAGPSEYDRATSNLRAPWP